jgi:hypothetical protein
MNTHNHNLGTIHIFLTVNTSFPEKLLWWERGGAGTVQQTRLTGSGKGREVRSYRKPDVKLRASTELLRGEGPRYPHRGSHSRSPVYGGGILVPTRNYKTVTWPTASHSRSELVAKTVIPAPTRQTTLGPSACTQTPWWLKCEQKYSVLRLGHKPKQSRP